VVERGGAACLVRAGLPSVKVTTNSGKRLMIRRAPWTHRYSSIPPSTTGKPVFVRTATVASGRWLRGHGSSVKIRGLTGKQNLGSARGTSTQSLFSRLAGLLQSVSQFILYKMTAQQALFDNKTPNEEDLINC